MNEGFTISEVLAGTGGRLMLGEKKDSVTGVSIDSRTLEPGELFVAIRGERFDGHQFFYEALKEGAGGAIVAVSTHRMPDNPEEEAALRGKALIGVHDTTEALQNLARFHRRRWGGPIIGITGSNGKTTTKEMLAGILSRRFSVLASKGNLNNHIGVPLTLFGLKEAHDLGVLEMGISGPGELDLLGRITEPESGIITNIGPAHLKGLITVSEVAHAKSELLTSLKGGVAVLNKDDAYYKYLASRSPVPVIAFGRNPDSDLRLVIDREKETGLEIELVIKRSAFDDQKPPAWFRDPHSIRVSLPVIGEHQAMNAAAAAAAALSEGCSPEDIKAGLESFRPVGMRMEVLKWSGRSVLNDAYNANPASMEAALQALSHFGGSGKRVAVLGDMKEMGAMEEEWHRRVGAAVAGNRIGLLIAVGELAGGIAEGALAGGMAKEKIVACREPEEAAELLKQKTREGDAILIKGSRGARMERVLDALGLSREDA